MNDPIKPYHLRSIVSTSLRCIGLCIVAFLCLAFEHDTDATGADIRQASGLSVPEVFKTFAALWYALWPKPRSRRPKQ